MAADEAVEVVVAADEAVEVAADDAVEVAADEVVDEAAEVVVGVAVVVVGVAVVVVGVVVVDDEADEVVEVVREAHLELKSLAYSRMFISRPLVGMVMTQSGGLSLMTAVIRSWHEVAAHILVYWAVVGSAVAYRSE